MINKHPDVPHPVGLALKSNDTTTLRGIAHRELLDNDEISVFMDFMVPLIQNHHISLENLEKRISLIKSLKNPNISMHISPYPVSLTTQKGNLAEIFLAEYLQLTTETHLPVYRLRYNPNTDQSMKGDDVLLFDLDSNPQKIIVGEAKFRKTPSKQAVVETVEGLIRSQKVGLPMSLMFVAERLFEEGQEELGDKILGCASLFASNKLKIQYVGLLMSDLNARNPVNKHTTEELHNLLMISVGMKNPDSFVQESFKKLEENL